MPVVNKVTNMATRRRVLEAADKLARTNIVDTTAYEELLNAVGQQFSEDFGVDCKVAISVDKTALMAKMEQLEKEQQS